MGMKNELYAVLNDFGKENIQIAFQNNINSSIPKIKEILSKTIATIYEKKENIDSDYNQFEKPLSSLCEALLHFLLTTASLPSQRKIILKELEIDLIIPDIKTLFKDPKETLILKFDKDSSTLEYIRKIENIQKNKENIWIVSSSPLDINYRNYVIYNNKEEYQTFLANNKTINKNYNNCLIDGKNEINKKMHNNMPNINPNVIPFFNIIVDITKFLKNTKYRGLKIVP
ncbi:MAG TPA: hypothetical protein VFU79_06165 [Nitrososphaeraceae archaeon]|nr:hypothetical protein [Nitrososphaeraceae archaeon]